MSRPQILVTESERFSAEAARQLQAVGDVTLADLDRVSLLAAAEPADVMWVRLRHHIDREIIAAAPNLQFIVSPTTGLNHIDLHEAERRGIRVISLRGEVDFLREVRATAEHTIGLIFSLLRHVPHAYQNVCEGAWDRDAFRGRELHEKTLGVVGFGRLGRLVAKYANAFDAAVLAADPNVDQQAVPADVQLVSLETLLSRADIVTLHVNLDDQTAGFFGQQQFQQMRRGAWLVNTARGELIDECALLAALRRNKLSGAALDVLCDERSTGMSHHPLVQYAREHHNLLITPHIGGCTTESMAKTENFLANKLCAALQASSVGA